MLSWLEQWVSGNHTTSSECSIVTAVCRGQSVANMKNIVLLL